MVVVSAKRRQVRPTGGAERLSKQKEVPRMMTITIAHRWGAACLAAVGVTAGDDRAHSFAVSMTGPPT